jgi:KipI family sensor histidine kinase inhibitor
MGGRDGSLGDLSVDALGEAALLVRFAATDRDPQPAVLAMADALVPGIAAGRLVDVVPGDGSLLVRFDGTDAGEAAALEAIRGAAARPVVDRPGREHVLRVRYGGEDGPDLEAVAALTGLTAEAVVAAHTGTTHVVRFLGFAPGFPYLGGLPDALVVPRLDVPRTAVPAGSVGIAERHTGIYPAALPAGWRIIGRTATPMIDPSVDPTTEAPTTLLPGDRVRFEAE